LITGASAGLGSEFARQLAPQAKALILVARRIDRLEALKNELERPGLTIHTRQADLSNRAEVESLLEWLKANAGGLNLLINNAGIGDHGLFEESDWNKTAHMLDVNIWALTRLSYALLPVLRKQSRSAILNVSSIAGFIPIPGETVYAASKAFVTSFSEGLRMELRGTGVRVTALCPGPVSTEFSEVAQRPGKKDPVPAPDLFKVPAWKVVTEGLAWVEKDRPRGIPGLLMTFVMALTVMTPMFILRLAMQGRGRQLSRTQC